MTIQIILDTLKDISNYTGIAPERELIIAMLDDVNTNPENILKQGIITTEEGSWPVEELNKIVREHGAMIAERKHILKPVTGWRIPKRGDKVRMVKQPKPTLYGHDWLKVGDVVEVICASGCSTGEPMSEGADGWQHTNTTGICFKKPNGEPHETTVLPLDCFEMVNETTAQEAK